MPKVRRETLAEQGLKILRGKILDGELRPGDPVTEDAMAKTIGVSRPTMREVLRMLVAEGLLTRHPTTRILQVTMVTPDEIREIYAARFFLESAGLDAAATVAEDAFAGLHETLAEMEAAVEASDLYALVRADGRCHSETVRLAGNRYLSELHGHLMSKLNLAIALMESDDPLDNEEILRVHKEYVELVVKRRVDEAKRQLQERLRIAERDALQHFDDQGQLVDGRRTVLASSARGQGAAAN